MDKLVIKQIVKYEFVCPVCGYSNSNVVDNFNECSKCNTRFLNIEYIDNN